MKRLIRVLLTITYCAMWAMMAVFALAGCQTMDWCMRDNIPIPWQAWAMIAVVAVWCVIAVHIPGKSIDEMKRFLEKLTEE